MKQNGMLFVCLVLAVSLFVFPAFAQKPSDTNFESFFIDNFDNAGNNQDWVWATQASRFVVEGYPKLQYFNGSPAATRFRATSDGALKVLGAEVKFTRKGDNWFEIYPAKKDSAGKMVPYELALTGLVQSVDMWVWGANYNYSLYLMVRDVEGRVHNLPVTRTSFSGWEHFSVNVPQGIPQISRFRGGQRSLHFVGFRIITDVNAAVDLYNIYIDDLKYLTNTFLGYFDGFDLDGNSFEGQQGAAQ